MPCFLFMKIYRLHLERVELIPPHYSLLISYSSSYQSPGPHMNTLLICSCCYHKILKHISCFCSEASSFLDQVFTSFRGAGIWIEHSETISYAIVQNSLINSADELYVRCSIKTKRILTKSSDFLLSVLPNKLLFTHFVI